MSKLHSPKPIYVISIMVLFVLVTFFLLPNKAAAGMFNFFKKETVHLSPEVKGHAFNNGIPMENVEVYRDLKYDNETYTEIVKTDSKGRFQFTSKEVRSSRPNSLLENRIWQEISVKYQGKFYILWYLVNASIEPHQTITETLAKLECDISEDENEFELANIEDPNYPHGVLSRCKLK